MTKTENVQDSIRKINNSLLEGGSACDIGVKGTGKKTQKTNEETKSKKIFLNDYANHLYNQSTIYTSEKYEEIS